MEKSLTLQLSTLFAMKHILLYILFLNLGLAATAADYDLKSAFKELDREVELREKYLKLRAHNIDSLRRYLVGKPNKQHYLKLGEAYDSYKNDSLLYFYKKGLEGYKNDTLAMRMYLRYAAHLPVSGIVSYAIDDYEALDTTKFSKPLMVEYHKSGREMYAYIAILYNDVPEMMTHYRKRAIEHQTHYIQYLPENSSERLYYEAELALFNKQIDVGTEKINHLLNTLKDNDNLYARSAYIKANIEKAKGNEDGYLYYLSRSAIADIKSGTLEVAALQELGDILDAKGDVNRAHQYLTVALENAVKCDAKMRIIESAKLLPLIEKVHESNQNRTRLWMTTTLILLGVALLCVVVGLYYLRREIKKEKHLRARLAKANQVKDLYLTRFLDLCTMYVNKMNKLCHVAHSKIAAGKTEDLDKLVRSGKFVEEESKEFYETFDEAFLHIYPTFMEEVNKLLRPDAQIILKENERLNADLRILAFMRLGIEESVRIAQVMNYSVNTIYTYRNKMRSRAINRDTFEADVMNIGKIDKT